MGAFWKTWVPFLDFLASLEGVKIQRKKTSPKRSPEGPGMSAGSNGEKCVGPEGEPPPTRKDEDPDPSQTQSQTRARPEANPDQNQSQNPEKKKEKETTSMTSETPFVPRGTVANITYHI